MQSSLYRTARSRTSSTSSARPTRKRPGSARLPAYGRRLLALRHAGRVPSSNQVVIGVDSWNLVNAAREDVVVLPPGVDPAAIDWRAVSGLSALLIVEERAIAKADALAGILVAIGVRGCAALILNERDDRVGWRLYRSHFDEGLPGKLRTTKETCDVA